MKKLRPWCYTLLTLLAAVSVFCVQIVIADSGSSAHIQALENVRGAGCYAFGDNETPAQAKRTAMAMAQEQAVRNHRVYVESTSTVRNFQLEDDLIHTVSAGMLQQIRVEKEEKKGQEICITVTAKLSPVSFEDLIRQRANAKEVAQVAQTPLMPQSQGYGLRVWVDKTDGHYIEGERLVVYVQSERDAYLTLDYFMADGCVLHLVPNVYRGQAFIRSGQTYSFGGDPDPEHILIIPPFGAETIKAMLSAFPIEDGGHDAGRGCDESRAYLRRLESGIKKGSRGVQLTGVDRSVALVTTSKTVDTYTKGKRGLLSEK
jgi:hypothetical protein